MSWEFSQYSGILRHNGAYVAQGWSGQRWGMNNPEAEEQRNIGPIPRGEWIIRPLEARHGKKTLTMRLDPVGHPAWNRHDFYIHGYGEKPEFASEGCIILDSTARLRIADSGDPTLIVVR